MAGEIKASIVSAKSILFMIVRPFFEALDFSASPFIHLIRTAPAECAGMICPNMTNSLPSFVAG
jgi:hypothetical protein